MALVTPEMVYMTPCLKELTGTLILQCVANAPTNVNPVGVKGVWAKGGDLIKK